VSVCEIRVTSSGCATFSPSDAEKEFIRVQSVFHLWLKFRLTYNSRSAAAMGRRAARRTGSCYPIHYLIDWVDT
jgi:hypothetical protein